MDFNTKCPLCKIGFTVMCTGKKEFVHMDIIWTNEAGLHADCKDPEALYPFIIENEKHGTKFSLSAEMDNYFQELNNQFHADPSPFSKDNVDETDFAILFGEFIRYADYMDDRETIKGTTWQQILDRYREGKNLLEIVNEFTIKEP